MSGYTISGPFVSGGAPGLDAPFFNNVEDWIQQLEGDLNSVVLNGSTSGTVTLYQVLQGTFKLCLIRPSNFRNGGGSAQTIALPTAFTSVSWAYTFDMPEYTLKNGGSSIMSNIYYLNSIGAGGFGTANGPSSMIGNLLFHTSGTQGWDTISFNGSQSSASTGFLWLLGI